MSKMKTCKACGAEIASGVKTCPHCGAKNKKPFYKKIWFWALIIIVLICVIASLGDESSTEEKEKLVWPTSGLATMIPQLEAEYGEVYETSSYVSIDAFDVSKDNFKSYIESCKEKGFTEDYTSSSDYFSADTKDGYSLTISYYDGDVSISLNAPSTGKENVTLDEDANGDEGTTKEEPTAEKLINGMRPEFKEAMDSYEEFYDEYCEFMEDYSNNSSDPSLIAKYATMVAKLADMDKKFEAWDESEMNDAELKYYADVNARVSKKLIDVAY